MTLQETAFADLIALGWKDPVEVYTAIWSQTAKALPPVKLKASAVEMSKRGEVLARIKEVRDSLKKTTRPTSATNYDAKTLTKEAIIEGMLGDLELTDNAKDKAEIRNKIAALQGYKKDEAVGKEDPFKIYAPMRCEGCSLFLTALEKGEISIEDIENEYNEKQ